MFEKIFELLLSAWKINEDISIKYAKLFFNISYWISSVFFTDFSINPFTAVLDYSWFLINIWVLVKKVIHADLEYVSLYGSICYIFEFSMRRPSDIHARIFFEKFFRLALNKVYVLITEISVFFLPGT